MIMKIACDKRLICLFFLLFFLPALKIFAGPTSFEYNKLIFGNGGGFVDREAGEDGYADSRIELLNLSNSGGYAPKDFKVEGDYVSLNIEEYTSLTVNDEVNIRSTHSEITGGVKGILGDLKRHFLVIKADGFSHYIAGNYGNAVGNYRAHPFNIQYSSGPTYIGNKLDGTDNVPIVQIGNRDGYPSVGIGGQPTDYALTVHGDLLVSGVVSAPAGSYSKAAGYKGYNKNSDPIGLSWLDYQTTSITFRSVKHVVIVSGIGSVWTADAIHSSEGQYKITLKKKNKDGSLVPVPTHSSNIEEDTLQVINSPSTRIEYLLFALWIRELDPLEPGEEYVFTSQLRSGLNLLGTSGRQQELVVLASPSEGIDLSKLNTIIPTSSASVITPVPYEPTTEEQGNYMTKNKVRFSNGGLIEANGKSVYLKRHDKYARFRVGKLVASKVFIQDVLKIFSTASDPRLRFRDVTSNAQLSFYPNLEFQDPAYTLNKAIRAHPTPGGSGTMDIDTPVTFSKVVNVRERGVGIGRDLGDKDGLYIAGALAVTGRIKRSGTSSSAPSYGVLYENVNAIRTGVSTPRGFTTFVSGNIDLTAYTDKDVFTVIMFASALLYRNLTSVDAERRYPTVVRSIINGRAARDLAFPTLSGPMFTFYWTDTRIVRGGNMVSIGLQGQGYGITAGHFTFLKGAGVVCLVLPFGS